MFHAILSTQKKFHPKFFFTQNFSSKSCGWSKAWHNATKHSSFTHLKTLLSSYASADKGVVTYGQKCSLPCLVKELVFGSASLDWNPGSWLLFPQRNATQVNGSCCCEWKCSHCTQATSTDLRSNLRARVQCGLGQRCNTCVGSGKFERRTQADCPRIFLLAKVTSMHTCMRVTETIPRRKSGMFNQSIKCIMCLTHFRVSTLTCNTENEPVSLAKTVLMEPVLQVGPG